MPEIEIKILENIRDEYKNLIITPKMSVSELINFAIKKYHLIPSTCTELGLDNHYLEYVTEYQLLPYAEKNGFKLNKNEISYQIFKVPYPQIDAGFLYKWLGSNCFWGNTHIIFENYSGFVSSNYEVYCYELIYARGIDYKDVFCENINDISVSAKRYLENIYIWQNNLVNEFELHLKYSLANINKQIINK